MAYQLQPITMRKFREKQPFTHEGVKYEPPRRTGMNKSRINDPKWRLNNLYYITDKDGNVVKFKMFPIQEDFLENMWHRNVILKSRQHGMTTFIDLWTLDKVLFVPNITAVIIAHKADDAAQILKTKAEFPYDNLHPSIRERVSLTEKNKTNMVFSNGSSIKVTTSGRSGTAQILHVSELGYTSRHRPEVASEIVNGSFPAVHQNGFIFVESTAEGTSGEFFELCKTSENKKKEKRELTRLDFKFHFYAWHQKPDNVLSEKEAKMVPIKPRLEKYFQSLEDDHGIVLNERQRAWYATQEDVFQDEIKQEHPSTPQEAFEASGKGMYFKTQMSDLREEGRLTKSPHVRGRLVHTFWDLGINDETAGIFMQNIGNAWHVIDYYEESDQGIDWHIEKTRSIAAEKGYLLGDWVGPHDLKQRQKNNGVDLWTTAKELGVNFIIVPKVNFKMTSINILRGYFSMLTIDESLETFIQHLDNYRKEWDKIRGTWKDKPFHDQSSNASDALQQWGMYIDQKLGRAKKEAGARRDPRNNVSSPMAQDGDPKQQAFVNTRHRSMRGFL